MSTMHMIELPHERRRGSPTPEQEKTRLARAKESLRDERYPQVVNPWGLTPVQCEIMRLLTQDRTQRQVGEEMNLSFKTVATHMDRVRDKMVVHTTLQACILWTSRIKKAA